MRTSLCRITPAALGLLFAALVPAFADDRPEDLYFDGFQTWKKAEALLKEGRRDEALPKLREAEQKIMIVQRQFPDWQPDIVNYRLKHIRSKLTELTPAPLTPRPMDPSAPKASPAPPAHTIPDEKTPSMPTLKPTADYLNRPIVPFIFNGETYYKMLLSLENRPPGPPSAKGSPP